MSISIRALDAANTMPFIKAQWLFYQNNPNWVAPLVMDRKKLLNQQLNPFYKHSALQMFLAERNGKVVGRIAAITNDNHNATFRDKVGFFGFFECIDDHDVAKALIQAASEWLQQRGMTHIRGPVNPSMNDECGLLVDGFDGPPVILMTYNPPYYQALLEGAGLEKAKDLYAYILDQQTFRTDKLNRMQDMLMQRYGLTIRNVNMKNKAQFQADVAALKDIYNAAWEENWGFVKMTDEEFDFLAADLKQIANPDYVFFVESHGKTAGFCLALPDVNQCFIHNPSGNIVTGLWHLLTKKKRIDTVRIIVLGVLPEFHNKGIDAVMYHVVASRALANGVRYGEASWILEDNDMMNRALRTTMKGTAYRTYRIFEKPI
jgi:GNAT superfamily N-acetyltransferase